MMTSIADKAFEPIKDRIVVQPLAPESVTKGGIIIPDSVKESQSNAVVLSVGPEVKEIKPGDTVVYAKNRGVDVVIGMEHYLVMREEDALGYIR